LSPASITTTGASLNGSLYATGTSDTAVWVFWGQTDQGATNTGWGFSTNWPAPQSTGTFSYAATLTPDQTYTYRYAASNTAGWAYGGPQTFNNGQVTVLATDAIARVDNPSDTGRFTVFRPNWATNGALTVSYSMSGSATNGVDYSPLSGSATILDGQSNVDVVVSALWNPAVTNDQQAVLTLSTGSGLYAIGSPNAATVTIVAATTWYVATNGSDSAAGTNWATAFQTVSNGVAHAGTVGTVYVSNGSYSVSVPIIISNNITLRSVNGRDATTIYRYLTSGSNVLILTSTATNALVDGFTITNGNNGVWMNAGVLQNCTIRNCSAAGMGQGGLYVGNATVQDCLILDNQTRQAGGAKLAGAQGVIRRCTFAGNYSSAGGGGSGGGLEITAGLVEQCVITSNSAGTATGGGVYLNGGGVLRNCLVSGNTANSFGAGVYMTGNGSIQNCTIVDNAGTNVGVGVYMTGGAATNCIVYYNTCTPDSPLSNNVANLGGTFAYSCSKPLQAGTSNIVVAPSFVNRAARNYHLALGSAGTDAGATLAGVTNDLDGVARPQGAGYDMGAYEYVPVGAGPLICNFNGNPLEDVGALTVTFTGTAAGGTDANYAYYWDFDGNGTTDAGGLGSNVVSHTYGVGLWTVGLVVSNATGETTNALQAGLVYVAPNVVYVATNGSHTYPFETWAKAATNVQAAIDAARVGSLTNSSVLVSNGVYALGASLSVTKGITVSSFGGRDVTTIRPATNVAATLLSLNSAGAVFQGFTLRDGTRGGVNLLSGALRDCVVVSNQWNNGGIGGAAVYAAGVLEDSLILNNQCRGGGGVRLEGAGIVRRCTIAGNRSDLGGAGVGGGVAFNAAGMVDRCVITNNNAGNSTGGGVNMSAAGVLRNSVVAGNTASSSGGGVYMTAGTLVHCTIADNAGGPSGGGLYMTTNAAVTNCIVYYNSCIPDNPPSNNVVNVAGRFAYSCSTPLAAGTANTAEAPSFVNRAARNYRLRPGSVGVDAGVVLAAVTNDLDGIVRPLGAGYDMGAYEATPAGGTAVLFW
jgi:hypothetical protein